jgi:4-hydroxy-tetrahydrodipicolinate synthase
MFELNGGMVAIVTPFKPGDFSIDIEALSRLVERQIDGSSDGIIVCGTTGESATMTEEEQIATIRRVVDVAEGRVPVIAGTGSNNTAAMVAFTRKVRELGVDAALVVCPPYNKPSQNGLVAHFLEAEKAGLPVIVYNVPGRTAVGLTAETVGRLAQRPGIVAIKEATADLSLGTKMMRLAEGKIAHLSGDDFTTYPYVAMGGQGCISVVANVDPQLIHDVVEAATAGDRERGMALHAKVHQLAEICFMDSNPVPVKAMLAEMDLCSAAVRLPLVELPGEKRELLQDGLRAAGYLK